jgi:hypothetical protein
LNTTEPPRKFNYNKQINRQITDLDEKYCCGLPSPPMLTVLGKLTAALSRYLAGKHSTGKTEAISSPA